MILGIDEVGRGPWAGPLVVGAVVLDAQIEGLTDSKKLTKNRRETLNDEITQKATAVGLGWVHADELDELGMAGALVEATKRAVGQILVPYHEIIIDGTVNFLKDTGKGQYVTTMKKADLLIPSVSAASVVAKVARDRYMLEQHARYPEYGFDSHVGYGTAQHRAAIEAHGVVPLHRLSFAPLAKYKTKSRPADADTTRLTAKAIGDSAEATAANHLESVGYTIIGRNWKTRFCEIDIIATKERTVVFVEVKHRKEGSRGGGLGAITPKKLRQMKFAAELYAANQAPAADIRLAVIATIGNPPQVETLLLLD